MKVVHSSTLLCLAIPIVLMTTKSKVSKKNRYTNILRLTLVAQLIYVLPLIYSMKKCLDEKGQLDHATLFSDWFAVLMRDTNVNVFGVKTMVSISLAIFVLLLMVQFMTCWL